MKKIVLRFLMLLPVCLLAKNAALGSNDTLKLDLGSNSPGSVLSVPGNRSFDLVVLENTLPGFNYRVEINNAVELPAPLSYEGMQVDGGGKKGIDSECDSALLVKKITALETYLSNPVPGNTSEKELATLVRDLDREKMKVKCPRFNSRIETLRLRTMRVINESIHVRTGHTVTITIRRDTLVWTFIYKGDEHGKWLTTYGFGMTFSALEKRTYFTKHYPDSNYFIITKSRRPEKLDLHYTPAVFFSYFPFERSGDAWNPSITGGLGFDLSAPVFFLGGSLTFRYNIGVSAGLALQQQYRLKDQYSENEIIPIAQDIDQLHDKIYRPNLFFSINLRLDQNPFQNRANGEAGE